MPRRHSDPHREVERESRDRDHDQHDTDANEPVDGHGDCHGGDDLEYKESGQRESEG